jgi:ribosome biogenesis GTPase
VSDTLVRLGWTPERELEFEPYRGHGFVPGRVAVEHRSAYVVSTAGGELRCELAGKLRHDDVWPTVGDWVAVREPETITALLPRHTVFSRKEPWLAAKEQVLAANADTVLVAMALTAADFKLRRLERYLATGWESGATPAIVLTKPDLCDDVTGHVLRIESIAFGVAVHVVNGLTGDGVDALRRYLEPNQTVALLGSSGVGKSTLVNHLAGGEAMPTGELGDDGRGRHTTRHRELILLPNGGLVLDTPGLRELQLWDVPQGLEQTFEDVAAVAARCRFADCGHVSEPGCAVREALHSGELPRERWESWQKLQRELARLERKLDDRTRSEHGREIRKEARSRRRAQRPPRSR